MNRVARAVGVARTRDVVRVATDRARRGVAHTAALGRGAVVDPVAQRRVARADIARGDATRAIDHVRAALFLGGAGRGPARDAGRRDPATAVGDAALIGGAAVRRVALECSAVELGLARDTGGDREDHQGQPHVATVTHDVRGFSEMEPSRLRCVVVVPGGPSRRVGQSGLLIGRQGDCDIVATDPAVSRRHALVRLTGDGAELVPLGRGPVELNGVDGDKPRPLAHGDVLTLPGLELRIELSIVRPASGPDAQASLLLERGGSGFGIAHTPFTLGGGDADDLIVKGWPDAALRFHLAQGELFVEPTTDTILVNDVEIEADALEPLAIGDRVSCRGETFTIAAARGRVATTAVGARSELPSRVVVEMLPRGGRVVFTVGARDHAVYLADRRFDLVVALLRPPGDYQPGEFIPDDTVRSVVWPRKPSVSRQEINTLISRCRRDLIDVGLAGPRLLERAPGGGGTRLTLAAGAEVEVRS